jgi:uncharacterized protein (DUF488 family)
MDVTICTIGFAGKTAEEFFALLAEAGVQRLIDVRENRVGQLSGFAKFPDLSFFLDKIGHIPYSYEPRFAPSPEIREAYRSTKDWPQYQASFLQLMRDRDVAHSLESFDPKETAALLCSEPGPEKCHRRLVAELVAEHIRGQGHVVHIRHLITEKAKRPRRKQ